jgi:hypothetical protein
MFNGNKIIISPLEALFKKSIDCAQIAVCTHDFIFMGYCFFHKAHRWTEFVSFLVLISFPIWKYAITDIHK